MTNDTIKCDLRPLVRADYLPVTFTDAQWAELVRAFPQGVCDYSQPGVDRVATQPWLSYQDASGRVVYGGRPLGAEPGSRPVTAASVRAPTACVQSGRLRLRLGGRRGRPLRSARVYVNGRRVSAGGAGPSARVKLRAGTVSLTGLPAAPVRVRVVVVTRAGHRLTVQRRFAACAGRRARSHR
jgi:hypothetical protein